MIYGDHIPLALKEEFIEGFFPQNCVSSWVSKPFLSFSGSPPHPTTPDVYWSSQIQSLPVAKIAHGCVWFQKLCFSFLSFSF